MKIVLDTNVILSGLASPNGTTGRILAAWYNHCFDLVASEYQLAEIARVLTYPKIRRLLQWDNAQVQEFIQQFCLRVEMVDIEAVSVQVPTDPDDSPILASLIAARADMLVSGDQDLLDLKEQYAIVSPAEFVQRL